MLDRTETGLYVFENFRIDYTLPKYVKLEAKRKNSISKQMDSNGYEEDMEMPDNLTFRNASDFIVTVPKTVGLRFKLPRPKNWFLWLLSFFKRKTKEISVFDFFHGIKSSTQDINLVGERAKGYEIAIKKAMSSGQTALLERLKDGIHLYKMETLMLSVGISKFVHEKTIVEFYKKSKKGLRLDFIKNFVRAIPDELIDLKTKADELDIFDNYAILHYDPELKSYSETKQEEAARKDPILFGMVKGHTKLYFIGEWIDEMCDLTLEKMAEVLGREAQENFFDVTNS